MRDTTAAAEAIRVAAIRRMAPAERLRQALVLSESVRTVALARLRVLHPGRSDLELVEILLGCQLVPVDARPVSR